MEDPELEGPACLALALALAVPRLAVEGEEEVAQHRTHVKPHRAVGPKLRVDHEGGQVLTGPPTSTRLS